MSLYVFDFELFTFEGLCVHVLLRILNCVQGVCVLILRCRSPGLADRAEGGCQVYTLMPFDYHVHTLLNTY